MFGQLFVFGRLLNIQLYAFFIAFAYCFVSAYSATCTSNPYDVEDCIHNTTIQCYWSVLTESCQKSNGVDYGCDNSLNRQSCVRQLYSFGNSSQLKLCYFGQRCQDASSMQLNMIGCSPQLSFYACISITTPEVQCKWENEQCIDIENLTQTISPVISSHRCQNNSNISGQNLIAQLPQDEIDEIDELAQDYVFHLNPLLNTKTSCQDTYHQSVNSNVCANIAQNIACYHGNQSNYYKCVSVSDVNLQKINCNTAGLNRYGCLSISTPGQNCVFQNGLCSSITSTVLQNITCISFINRLACISFTDLTQTCRWNSTMNLCQKVTNYGLPCQNLTNVSISTCASSTNQCMFNATSGGCRQTNSSQDNCTSIGISQLGCLSLNQTCRFDTQCQQMSKQDLNIYRCNSNLTRVSCLNILTPGQYCQWQDSGHKCLNINILPNNSCTSFHNVNGNLCQAITLNACKYNGTDNNCVTASIIDQCETFFLNIVGCVQVAQKNSVCGWVGNFQQCYNIVVISGITKCTDLRNVNAAACQQVYRPEIDIDERNCKYDAVSRGCVTYPAVDKNADCTDSGLNQYGCVSVVKAASWCKWQTGACLKISYQVEIQSQYCINLQQVNAAVCSLALAGAERCKYEPVSNNCITTVDVNVDECSTPGLNSYGCGSIKTEECYFDIDLIACKATSQLSFISSQQFFQKAQCQGQFLTKQNCLLVQTPNELCIWNSRQSECTYINLTPKEQCNFVKKVNSNSCAAVFVDFVSPDQSYCAYNSDTGDCKVQTKSGVPCSLPGLNVYSCSAMTTSNSYCYFDNTLNLCKEWGSISTKEAEVSKQWAALQIDCKSLNSRSCPLNNWSVNWKCVYNNTLPTGLCYNVNFQNDSNAGSYSCSYFNNANLTTSPFVCAATKQHKDYCMYDSGSKRCQTVVSNQLCSAEYQNINSCLFKTLKDYCEWSQDDLKCNQIPPDSRAEKVCIDPINQNQCTKVVTQICQFNETLSLCQPFTLLTNITKCTDLARPGMTYNKQACQEITTPGQICDYNTITRQCYNQSVYQSTCTRLGSNKGSCFARTTKVGCYWNNQSKSCQDIADLQVDGTLNISCSYGINKVACLTLIKNGACQWDLTLGQCTSMNITNNSKCTDLNATLFQQNQYSCQTITKLGQNCYYDVKTALCNNFSQSSLKKCSDYIRNINSCLQLTNPASLYCIWDPILLVCNTVLKSNLNLQICSDPVNKNICLDTTSNSCKWDTIFGKCSIISTANQQCSQLSNGTNLYNRMTCVGQSYNGTVLDPSPVNQANCSKKGIQFDYCSYNPVTKLCFMVIRKVYSNITGLCKSVYESTCNINYNYEACIRLTLPECYFDTQCRSSFNQMNVITCSQANYLTCPLITTPNQLCIMNYHNELCEVYPGTQLTQNQNTCFIGDYDNSVNSNVCTSIQNGHCTWDSSNQYCINATSNIIYECSDLGINNGTCTDYTNQTCTFNQGNLCQGTPKFYTTCIEVNQYSQNKTLCAKVINQSCYYDNVNSLCVQVADFSALACGNNNVFNFEACIQITHINSDGSQNFCYFSPSQVSCNTYVIGVDSPAISCQDGNKFTCLYFTTPSKFCVWVTDPVTTQGSCQEYKDNSLQSFTAMSLVGSCTNVSKQACFQVQSVLQCRLVNNTCIDVTIADTAVTSCTSMSMINDLVCSNFTLLGNNKQYSQFQAATSTNTSYCVTSGTNQNCDVMGMNIFSCIEHTWLTVGSLTTGAECLWNVTALQCQIIEDPIYYEDGQCSILNKNACVNNLNVTQPCRWDDNLVSCTVLPTTSTCSAYSSVLVSTFVCANAEDVACQYDTINNNCLVMKSTDSPLNQCSTPGLNRLGCLTQTPGLFCQWIQTSFYCSTMDESANVCNDLLNILGCISIAFNDLNCNYNTVTNRCQDFIVTSGISLSIYLATTPQQVTDSTLKFNAQTCSQITYPGAYTAYDSVNFVCVNLTVANNSCSTIGINSIGCLTKTDQPCQFSTSEGCQIVEFLSQLTCLSSYNLITCQQLTGQGCQYTSDTCSQVSATAKCSDISASGIVTNPQACATINNPSDFCQYDTVNLRCMAVVNNQSKCSTIGINQQACLNQTSAYCKFDNTVMLCQPESAYESYSCTDLVNRLNCLSIVTQQQVCSYNQSCAPFIIDSTIDCPISQEVNALACVMIIKQSQTCIYNPVTSMCQPTSSTQKCADANMNKYGCLQIITLHENCQWDESALACIDFSDIDQECSTPVNLNACLMLNPITENCIWQDGVCQTVTGSPICATLLLINSPLACQLAIDPCRYNINTKQCITLTAQDPFFFCNQTGLSQSACSYNTLDKVSCVFDQKCYLPSQFLICSQAQSPTECVTVIAACQWLDSQCVNFTKTNYGCDDTLPQLVTRQVCQGALTTSPINTCSYVTTYQTVNNKTLILTAFCLQITPKTCFTSEDQRSCVRLSSQPCIWNNITNQCSLIILQKYPGIYTCANLSNFVSLRTCVDLLRIGEYCTYIQNQCIRINPYAITTTCNNTINFDACTQINSGNQTCIWNIVNISNVIQDKVISKNQTITYPYVKYYQGNCQILQNFQSTNCSQNLNIYSCLAITTPGQYCLWMGYLCSTFQQSTAVKPPPIEMKQFTSINSNLCTLVNLDGQSVKYDAQINACVFSDYINDKCLTPGLNKAGCLNVTSEGCKWNSTTMTCSQYKPITSTFKSCSMIDKNVSSIICSQISTSRLMCTYDAINNMCIDTSPTVQCDDPGINQAGCLSLTSDTCVWRNNMCSQIAIIADMTSCNDVPFPTNAYSCQQISYFTQLCKYDAINLRCVSFNSISNETCLTAGLNLLSCSKITSNYCQFALGQCSNFVNIASSCKGVGQGNPGSCSLTKQPVDRCKFNFLNFACGPSNTYDVCSTPGINAEGCLLLSGCQWLDTKKSCQCKQLQKLLPPCGTMNNAFDCKARKDCFFTTQENNDATFKNLKFDYTVAQQMDLHGVCKSLTCSDMKIKIINANSTFNSSDILCKGNFDPFGRQCFASSTQQSCRSISSCEEIAISELSLYQGCSDLYFGDKPCQTIKTKQNCVSFSCSLFTTLDDCNHKYCIFTLPSCDTKTPQCLDIQCGDLSLERCSGIVNHKTCFWIDNYCQGISTCQQINSISLDLFKKEQTCNNAKQDNKQCGWVQTNISLTSNQCSSISCRYVGYNQETCSGVHVLGNVCVLVKPNCLSCEEIIDSCTCLSNQPYCAYDAFKSKCMSVPCSSYTTNTTCLGASLNGFTMCQYQQTTQKCSPQCSRLFSKTICNSNDGCLWSGQLKSCGVLLPLVETVEIELPYAVFSTFMNIKLIGIVLTTLII